jgi:hypothetical protein
MLNRSFKTSDPLVDVSLQHTPRQRRSSMVAALCAAYFICSMEESDERGDAPLLGVALGVDETTG